MEKNHQQVYFPVKMTEFFLIQQLAITHHTQDLVGLTDVAEILKCSRQNIRKYAIGYPYFPRPAVTGIISAMAFVGTCHIRQVFDSRDDY